jgi:hypothetical protein
VGLAVPIFQIFMKTVKMDVSGGKKGNETMIVGAL